MKKLLFVCLVSAIVSGCTNPSEKTSSTDYPSNAVGYNLDSSANIDLVKKMVHAFEATDSITYRSCYSDSAKFHDNGRDLPLSENLGTFSYFKSNGVTLKVEKVDPIWEVVNKEAAADGVTNYVISFQHLIIKKGDKEVKVIMNVVNGMKDGKIVEEWGLYDSKPIFDLIAQK